MKFIALALIATASAIQLNDNAAPYQPEQGQYMENMNNAADAKHNKTMGDAAKRQANIDAGVAASKADIEAYKASHRWT